MKLGNIPNVVKFTLGMVASASVALSLSNVALAAEAGTLVGVEPSTATQAETVSTPGLVVPNIDHPSVKNTTDPKLAEQQSPPPVASTTTDGDAVNKQPIEAPAPAAPPVATADSGPVPASVAANPDSVQVYAREGAVPAKTTSSAMVIPSAPVIPTAVQAVLPAVTPVVESMTNGITPGATPDIPVVYYQSKALPIQPVITTSAGPADLAATTPSALGHKPFPTKSSGLLGQLNSVLGGFIVPSFVGFGHTLISVASSLDLSFVVLVVLSLNLFISSYGLWLRRSGYANAARSDASAALTFATPFLMSYVRVHRTHDT